MTQNIAEEATIAIDANGPPMLGPSSNPASIPEIAEGRPKLVKTIKREVIFRAELAPAERFDVWRVWQSTLA